MTHLCYGVTRVQAFWSLHEQHISHFYFWEQYPLLSMQTILLTLLLLFRLVLAHIHFHSYLICADLNISVTSVYTSIRAAWI